MKKVRPDRIEDILEYRDGKLFWRVSRGNRRAGQEAGDRSRQGHRQVRVHGIAIYSHHIVWYLHHGFWPEMLDHEDRNPENNRIENLRECTRQQNNSNTGPRKNRPGKFKGVGRHWSKPLWVARIRTAGKLHRLGVFNTEEDAATAYNFAAAEMHRDFASYNTVSQPWLEPKGTKDVS